MTKPARQVKKNQSRHIIAPHPSPSSPYTLTYFRMVCRQHATLELQRLFKHRKRISVSSNACVNLSKVAHGHACTSN
jgi:hypothetical protein